MVTTTPNMYLVPCQLQKNHIKKKWETEGSNRGKDMNESRQWDITNS